MNGISCKNLVYGMKYGMNLIGYTPRIRGPFLGAGAVLTLFPAKHELSKDHLRPSTARRPRCRYLSCLVLNGLNVYNMYIICLNTYIFEVEYQQLWRNFRDSSKSRFKCRWEPAILAGNWLQFQRQKEVPFVRLWIHREDWWCPTPASSIQFNHPAAPTTRFSGNAQRSACG